MIRYNRLMSVVLFSCVPTIAYSQVIEIATFYLKDGISVEMFEPLDKAVEVEHVSKQPGFVSRETAVAEDGQWLVLVKWKDKESADASMNSFMSAPAAKAFLEKVNTVSMTMKRYED